MLSAAPFPRHIKFLARASGSGHVSEFGSRLSAAAGDRLIGAQNETYPPIWKRAQAVLPHSSMWRMTRAP